MIAQLRGTLVAKTSTEIVIDCSGVGYLVSVSMATSAQLPDAGEPATVLTLMSVREDAIQLFGFGSETERGVFQLLTAISGIGPKIALGILSSIALADLRDVILRNDLAQLQKLPGIGKKTAERIMIELRDKIGNIKPVQGEGSEETATRFDARQEAVAALTALGYTKQTAEKAIRQVTAAEPETALSVDTLIRKALRLGMK